MMCAEKDEGGGMMERLVEELYTFKGKVEDCENDYFISVQEKLREYEDAEEQGLLLRLPCKVGDKVWRVFNVNGREPVISSFEFTLSYYENWEREFGKTIFTSKEAAIEAANIKYDYVEYELQSGDSVESIGKKHGQHTTLTCPWIDRFMEANHIVDKKTFDELFKPGNIVKVPIWREKDE